MICFVWPGHMERKAGRQRAAIREWWYSFTGDRCKALDVLRIRANGYYIAKDWIGVNAAYQKARQIVDKDE